MVVVVLQEVEHTLTCENICQMRVSMFSFLLQTEELKGDALVPMVVEAIVHEDAQV